MLTCKSGVFIGVGNIPSIEELWRLPGAESSAHAMYSYFSTAYARGKWNVVLEDSETRPTQPRIIAALRKAIIETPERSCVVIYLSGHGVLTPYGDVFLACDSIVDAAYDTGVPVQRIVDMVTYEGKHDCHYCIMVDMCRTGKDAGIALRVPDNISVLYACEKGERAFELGGNSVFVESFLMAMKYSNGFVKGQNALCSIGECYELMKRATYWFRPDIAQHVEFVSEKRGDVCFPVPKRWPKALDVAGIGQPKVYLKTRSLDPEAWDAIREEYEVLVKSNREEFILVDEQTIREKPSLLPFWSDETALYMKVSNAGCTLRPHERINFVLKRYYESIYALFMECDRVNQAIFRRIAKETSGQVVPKDGNGIGRVVWKYEAYGVELAYLQCAGNQQVLLRGFSPEGRELPLEYVMPSCNAIYDYIFMAREKG